MTLAGITQFYFLGCF